MICGLVLDAKVHLGKQSTVTRLVDKMSVLTLRHLLPAILAPSAEPPLACYVIGAVLLVSMRSLLED